MSVETSYSGGKAIAVRTIAIIETLTHWMWALGGAVAVLMAINVTTAVVSRYLFRNPLAFTLDLTQYWWMPVLAAAPMAAALLRSEHITAPLLFDMGGPKTRRGIALGTTVLTFVTIALISWTLVEKALTSISLQEAAVGTPWVAIWPIRIVMVAAFFIFALQVIAEIIKIVVPDVVSTKTTEEVAA